MSTPPPPPPPAATERVSNLQAAPAPPNVAATGPPGAFLVELLIFNGYPFKDHWGYWVRSHSNPDLGVEIHATGDVRNGFKLEIKRSHDLRTPEDRPTKRVPLQWVDGRFFEQAMLNNGVFKLDYSPVCRFEGSAFQVKAPEKSLNTTSDEVSEISIGKKVTQRDCQTWIVESADQLARDNVFTIEVADYLGALQQ